MDYLFLGLVEEKHKKRILGDYLIEYVFVIFVIRSDVSHLSYVLTCWLFKILLNWCSVNHTERPRALSSSCKVVAHISRQNLDRNTSCFCLQLTPESIVPRVSWPQIVNNAFMIFELIFRLKWTSSLNKHCATAHTFNWYVWSQLNYTLLDFP